MIDWLRRVLRRDSPMPGDDPRLGEQAVEHARVMHHAQSASPHDPVIQAETNRADRWKVLYDDRQRGKVQR